MGALLIVGAIAGYWCLSGDDPGASALQKAAVTGQAIVGFGGAVLIWLRERRHWREVAA